jgi:hypothetical protein
MFKPFKRLIKKYRGWSDWEDFMGTVNFYRFNPHSIPIISNLLCKMGRHDYEPAELDKVRKSVILECFYCQRRKSSTGYNLKF